MDAVSSGKDFTWFFSQGWSTIVVALVIYGGGLTAEQIVLALWPQTSDLVSGKTKVMDPKLPVLFRLWWLTRLAHPFLVGAAISFVPGLPAPDFVTSHTSGALWFGFSGMLNGQLHQIAEAVAKLLVLGTLLLVKLRHVRIELVLDFLHVRFLRLHGGVFLRGDLLLTRAGVDALDDRIGSHRRTATAPTTGEEDDRNDADQSKRSQDQLRTRERHAASGGGGGSECVRSSSSAGSAVDVDGFGS